MSNEILMSQYLEFLEEIKSEVKIVKLKKICTYVQIKRFGFTGVYIKSYAFYTNRIKLLHFYNKLIIKVK